MGDTGADPFTIAEVLGHADLRMTKRYTHATDEAKRRALERIGQAQNVSDGSRELERDFEI